MRSHPREGGGRRCRWSSHDAHGIGIRAASHRVPQGPAGAVWVQYGADRRRDRRAGPLGRVSEAHRRDARRAARGQVGTGAQRGTSLPDLSPLRSSSTAREMVARAREPFRLHVAIERSAVPRHHGAAIRPDRELSPAGRPRRRGRDWRRLRLQFPERHLRRKSPDPEQRKPSGVCAPEAGHHARAVHRPARLVA